MEAAEFESAFWGKCLNTYGEETKQFAYVKHIGIGRDGTGFTAGGASVLDIGGGPVSMLLKTSDVGRATVLDPGASYWPQWVHDRYALAGIEVDGRPAEELDAGPTWTEAWIYNCLQHCDDPEKVIANARRACGRIRLFEWIDIPPHDGHPNMLTSNDLAVWLGYPQDAGKSIYVDDGGAKGRAFAGIFGV